MAKLTVPRNAVVYDVKSLNIWANEIHEWGVEKGWAEEDLPDDPHEIKLLVIEKLLMMHTEITEATEALRDVNFTSRESCLPKLQASYQGLGNKPEGLASELIDGIIRHLHLCAILGIDVEQEMEKKMDYNCGREFRHGGKNL